MCFGNMQKTGQSNSFNFQNSTTSNTYDPWATDAGKKIFGGAQDWLASNPWKAYSGPTAAAFGPEFDKASNFLSSLLGKTNQYTTDAGRAARSVVGAINPNMSVSDYMNPYVDATLKPAIRNINESADAARQRNAADAAMAGAYGGTAAGVRQALLDRETQRNIGDATSSAYSNAFNNAQTARLANLSTLLNAGTALSGIGQQEFGQQTTLASLLAGLGSQRQQAAQQGINNAIRLNETNQTMPLNRFGMLAQILRGIPLNQTSNTVGFGGGQQQQYQPNFSGFNFLGDLLGSIL